MTKIFDVAKYILNEIGEVSTMKLQKLCYYSQAWHMVFRENPIFDEDFEAWANGPVCRKLFNIHKGYFVIASKDIPCNRLDNNLSKEQKDTINKILEFYGSKSGAWLSSLSHKELPWLDTRERVEAKPSDNCKAIIPKIFMQNYYSSLENK